MFPSAANIIHDNKSDDDSSRSSGWLHSLSYKPRSVSPEVSESVHNSAKRHHNKKHRKRSRSPIGESSAKTEPSQSPFIIDKSSNPNIRKFGCIYKGEVPAYRVDPRTQILGFHGRLRMLDLDPEAQKEEIKRFQRSRYFSKKNLKRILRPGAQMPSNAPPQPTTSSQSAFVIIPEGASIPSMEKPAENRPEGLQKIADLNRAVYDNPQNIKSWFELIELQHQNEDSTQIFTLLERQLSIIERAVEKNSSNLRLRLLQIAVCEYLTELVASGAGRSSSSVKSLQHKDRVAKEWYDLVRLCPQFVSVWRGYLAHLRGRFNLYGLTGEGSQNSAFKRVDGLYKKALGTLSGIVAGRIVSHKPTQDTADETIDLLTEYCHWLSQSGFTERALTVWQAVIEFTCFCPPHLQSRDLIASSDRLEAFRDFWTSPNRGAVFSLPGARGWCAWNAEIPPSGLESVPAGTGDSVLAELDEDWAINSSTAPSNWSRLLRDWNAVSESAEDALLTARDLSAPEGETSLSHRRSRGLAWLGLERAREAVGWLPASLTMEDASEIEDTDRLPRFEDVEPLLLEVHLDPRVEDTALLERRKQRLVLLFLEFLGLWDAEVARVYRLPSELQQLHELSSLSFVQRQNITPRSFGFPWLRSSLETANSGGFSISSRMRAALISSSLEQASHLFPGDSKWSSTMRLLRFQHLSQGIERALFEKHITQKTALNLWRKKAKVLLSQAQNDLNLWLAYAKGLTQSACAASEDNSALLNEARKVFTSTLRMHPIPPTSEFLDLETSLGVLLPRLRIVHAFIELELGVGFPLEMIRSLSHTQCFRRALHLVLHAASGGRFEPQEEGEEEEEIDSVPPSRLAETGKQLAGRLQTLCLCVGGTSGTEEVAELGALLASFLLHLHLLSLGEAKLDQICGLILPSLRSIDGGVVMGYCARRFLRLALPSVSSVSVLSGRNRLGLTNTLLDLMDKQGERKEKENDEKGVGIPLMTSPLLWSHLLPFRVTANSGLLVSKTCTIEHQRSLQGLLPLLVLTRTESRVAESVRAVCAGVAEHLTATCPQASMRPQRVSRFEPVSGDNDTGGGEPRRLLGLASDLQVETMTRLLPAALDLFCVGLELDRWTSLVAGTADSAPATMENPLSHTWIQGAVPRIRSAFENALSATATSTNPLLRFPGLPSLALTLTPTYWSDHLRIVLWVAYMSFEWTLAGVAAKSDSFDAHRKQRTALKAIFYRAVEDLPWAKILYTELARHCPEDTGEVVDLLTSRDLRLRTFLEEVDLLLTSKVP